MVLVLGLLKASSWVDRLARWVLVPIGIAFTLIVFLGVLSRYVSHIPLISPIELARIGFVVSALGGLGGAMAEVLGEGCRVPVRRVGIRDEFGASGLLAEIFPVHGMTAEAVCEAARAAVKAKH